MTFSEVLSFMNKQDKYTIDRMELKLSICKKLTVSANIIPLKTKPFQTCNLPFEQVKVKNVIFFKSTIPHYTKFIEFEFS
jgi:hypothetical protein